MLFISKTVLTIQLCFYITCTDGARILAVFPMPSISHQVVFRPLTQALVGRGHEVIVITPDPAYPKGQAPVNLTEIDVHDVSYGHFKEIIIKHSDNDNYSLSFYEKTVEIFRTMIEIQLQNFEVQKLFKYDKNYFDLLLLESCSMITLGFQYIFNAPIIQISSHDIMPRLYDMMGSPTNPILYPQVHKKRLYNLSMWDKFVTTVKHIFYDHYFVPRILEIDYKLMQKIFGHGIVLNKQIFKNIKMIFINEHRLWVNNRPVPPSLLYIGGIYQTQQKRLPKVLKSYLDSSKNGVIYVSFGSNVLPSLLPQDKIKIMLNVFSKLPYNILMKWDQNELPERLPNVKTSKWLPQTDVLKHPKIKLFITQGGLQSTEETINAGVPVVGIPILADQWWNTENYVHHKIGHQLDISTLKELELKNSIETVINDPSYKNNILKLGALMREHPIKPLDNAVWWAEHVMKTGGDHLKPPAAHMPWTEYYELKLILICSVVILFILSLMVYTTKVAYRFIKRAFLSNPKLKIR